MCQSSGSEGASQKPERRRLHAASPLSRVRRSTGRREGDATICFLQPLNDLETGEGGPVSAANPAWSRSRGLVPQRIMGMDRLQKTWPGLAGRHWVGEGECPASILLTSLYLQRAKPKPGMQFEVFDKKTPGLSVEGVFRRIKDFYFVTGSLASTAASPSAIPGVS